MDTPLLDDSNTSEIPSLLIPMADSQLIVPTVTVAEMMPYQSPIVQPNVPGWYLGNLLWRGLQIPMISFEAINGGSIAGVQPTSQITIFNNTGVSDKLPFICIPTQGIPRLSRVTAPEITQLHDVPHNPYETMRVSVAGEPAILPDLGGLEHAWLALKIA